MPEITDTDLAALLAEVKRLRAKCGESAPDGETVHNGGQWSFSFCPHCDTENDDPWDCESFPNSEWRKEVCPECGKLYEVMCCEVSYVRARKIEGAAE